MLDLSSPPAIVERDTRRAVEVRKLISRLDVSMSTNSFDLMELLTEAKDNNYNQDWGYPAFDDYVSENLDMSARQAAYFIKINKNRLTLGISRSELEKVKVSKLKEIFTLDVNGTYKDRVTGEEKPLAPVIKELVEQAAKITLKRLKEIIADLKDQTDTQMAWMNFHVLKDAKTDVIEPAIAKIKGLSGNTITPEGDVKDISDGTALERMSAIVLSKDVDALVGGEPGDGEGIEFGVAGNFEDEVVMEQHEEI